MVSTHLKNISQNGNLPQIGVKIKNIWNHQPENIWNASISQTEKFQQVFFQDLNFNPSVRKEKRPHCQLMNFLKENII